MRATPGGVCSCASRAAAGGCRGCSLHFVAERLRDAAYNSAICRTKWCRNPEIPSGNDHSAFFFLALAEHKKAGAQMGRTSGMVHLFFLVWSLEEIVV
jgi:hypothetical protein